AGHLVHPRDDTFEYLEILGPVVFQFDGHEDLHMRGKRVQIDLGAIAADQPGFLKPLHPLPAGGRRQVHARRQIRLGDPSLTREGREDGNVAVIEAYRIHDALLSGVPENVNLDKLPRLGDSGEMSHWPLTREDIHRPAYRSLAQGIASAIASGSLRPGDRLPPHRDLAWRLGLSVQTVSRAYEELIRADLISGEVGRGSFVKSGPRETVEVPWYRAGSDRPPVDLSMMTPVCLPAIAEAWRDSMHRIADRMPDPVIYSFRPRQTMALYGGMAAAWLARCGMVLPAQRIL